MKWSNKTLVFIYTLAIAFVLSITFPEEALSRRGGFGGGGFRSSRGSKVSSWGSRSKSKSSTWGNKAKGTRSARNASSTTGKGSKADKALYQKASANGTAFKTRSDATKSFQTKYGSQYPSRYSTQPATRPSHIPQKTKVDGKNYDVSYSRNNGGYGYYGPSGAWMAYSVVRDVTMMSMLMNNHGYYYGGAPGSRGGGGFFYALIAGIFGLIKGIFIIIAIVVVSRYLTRM